ncbi:MAG: DMT family transporter, partial [Gammaproteobacteria bacterium]|nr:DMT family transporter [Gammaproteobacteria bacterium]
IWGIYWLPLRYIEQIGLSGGWAVVLANLIPLFILLPLSLRYRSPIYAEFRIIVVIGFFAGTALTFYSIGLIYTSVVRATLLFYLTPVWSTIIGMFILNERVGWSRWAAIAFGLTGLYFIVGGGTESNKALNIGDWFGIASGVAWGLATVLIKKNPDTTVTGIVTSQHCFSFLLALILCWLLPGIGAIPDFSVWIDATPVILAYSWLGLVPGLFAVLWASSKLFPGRVGILMMTEALVAVVSASILLNEQVAILEWFGVFLIISAGLLEVFGGSDETVQLEAI